ncbi:MAG: response regulator receiver protein [Pseudomonadota bacterium]
MADGKTVRNSIVLISPDREFSTTAQTAFSTSKAIEFVHIDTAVNEVSGNVISDATGVVVVDLDDATLESLEALQRLKRRAGDIVPIVTVVRACEPSVMRILVQMQIADFLLKPVSTADLVRACLRALKGPANLDNDEAEIFSFVPAAGGVGNTVLALQAAFLLHKSASGAASTCVVDLNFQHGSCAEYLDLEPRFEMSEVEGDADRLDHQLLDAMMSKHESGLAVLAAPNKPAEQKTFDAKVVLRVLDLASAYFDNVVLDLPRTWFPWTAAILRGSNHVYLTAEMTVPCIRHTQRLIKSVEAETERAVKPKVIINRFAAKVTPELLEKSDAKAVLGDRLAGGIANNYQLVRRAVDQGVPLDTIDPQANVIADLRRIILPEEASIAESSKQSGFKLGSLFGGKKAA